MGLTEPNSPCTTQPSPQAAKWSGWLTADSVTGPAEEQQLRAILAHLQEELDMLCLNLDTWVWTEGEGGSYLCDAQ